MREVDGDNINLYGGLAEMVERGLGERARGDDVVRAEEAGGGGGERGRGGGGRVEGEGDARVLAEGLIGRGSIARTVERGGGGEREGREGGEGSGAAAVGVGEQAAVRVVECDGSVT